MSGGSAAHEVLRRLLFCRGSFVRATDRAKHGPVDPRVSRLKVKCEFSAARAKYFNRHGYRGFSMAVPAGFVMA
jgi:hypothetical protein